MSWGQKCSPFIKIKKKVETAHQITIKKYNEAQSLKTANHKTTYINNYENSGFELQFLNRQDEERPAFLIIYQSMH